MPLMNLLKCISRSGNTFVGVPCKDRELATGKFHKRDLWINGVMLPEIYVEKTCIYDNDTDIGELLFICINIDVNGIKNLVFLNVETCERKCLMKYRKKNAHPGVQKWTVCPKIPNAQAFGIFTYSLFTLPSLAHSGFLGSNR